MFLPKKTLPANLTMIYHRTLLHYPQKHAFAPTCRFQVSATLLLPQIHIRLASNGISNTESLVKIGPLLRKLN